MRSACEGFTQEQAHGGTVDSLGIWRRRLCKDKACISGRWDCRYDTNLQRGFPKRQRGRTFRLANYVRDGNLLWTQAFGNTDGPLVANHGTRSGRLAEDVA